MRRTASAPGSAAAFALLCCLCSCARPAPPPATPLVPIETRAQREAEAEAEQLRATVQAGRLEGLRWPEFPDQVEALRRLYGSAGWQPLWIPRGRPTPQAREVVRHLARAEISGLRAVDYDAALLAARLDAVNPTWPPAERARLDAAISVDLLRNLSDLHLGRVNPRAAGFELASGRSTYGLVELVAELSRTDDVPGLLAGVEPSFETYARTREALAHYRRLASDPDVRPPPDLTGLRPGASHAGVPALRRYLDALGDAAGPGRGERYDPDLVAAVERFQERHGLTADGVVGDTTMAALAVPPARRVKQLELALERLRWLPSRFERPPIFVNVPEFRLYALRDPLPGPQSTPPLDMRVIVGKAFETETPIFAEDMTYLVFRPYWNVPYSIARGEVLPKLRRNPGYLARENMELVQDGRRVGVSASTLAGVASGAVQIRQRPGSANSLGLVKFMFPNEHNVYLHGTPARSLFARQRRDFSHGCIRVEDPVALAEHVLRGQPGWTRARIVAAMQGGPASQEVPVEPIPVYILYVTAVPRPDGRIGFFDDVYGHDLALETLLVGDGGPGDQRAASAPAVEAAARRSVGAGSPQAR